MKRIFNWQTILGAVLLAMSAAVYLLHYLIFRDAHHIFLYLVGDIAFVFVQVLLVTLILHRLLNYREKQSLLKKLNMVIGVFFSEAGTKLMKLLMSFDPASSAIKGELVIGATWTRKEFARIRERLKSYSCKVEVARGDLVEVRSLLHENRNLLLSMLENPNLLEHESFTDLLWAVFHLADELAYRDDIRHLGERDAEHIAGDIRRAYLLLIREWLHYMNYLKDSYPYLFSLAMRTNPFDAAASVEVK